MVAGAAAAAAAGGGSGVTPSVPSCSSRLKSLNLAWNSVGTPGALVMAMALETNNVLCVLSLSANAVGDAAGQRLADMLMVCFLFFFSLRLLLCAFICLLFLVVEGWDGRVVLLWKGGMVESIWLQGDA